jgi:hypothetical protein
MPASINAWNWPLLITGVVNFVVGLLVGLTLKLFSWGKRMGQLEASIVGLGSDIRDVGADVKVRTGDLGSKLQTLTEVLPARVDAAKTATDLLGREIGLQLAQIERSIQTLTEKS